MKTRLVRVQDISPDDEESWRRLGERALEPNPFGEPDFFLLAARHFPGYADARLVIAHEGSEFTGVLPVAAFDRPRMPPRRTANTAGQPKAISGLQTPLVDGTDPDRTIDALVGALGDAARHEGWPGILLFDEIGSDGPVAESLRRVCEARRCPVFVKDSWERGTVSRAGQWSSPIDGKRRREIGRRRRLLEEAEGAEVALVERSQDLAACEDFLQMEMAGWKGRDRGQAFARFPALAAWFRDCHRRLVDGGRLTLLQLNVGPTPIAMSYVVRAGEGLFCFRIAFDETYSTYGPGAMLMSLVLTFCRENTDAAWVDSMTDKDNAFFLGMLPERRTLSRLLIGTGGQLDRAVVSAFPAMTRFRAAQSQFRTRVARRSPPPHGAGRQTSQPEKGEERAG
jgi:CelD/BcsL family acetyltransferase involved in cellulose biosynthesis